MESAWSQDDRKRAYSNQKSVSVRCTGCQINRGEGVCTVALGSTDRLHLPPPSRHLPLRRRRCRDRRCALASPLVPAHHSHRIPPRPQHLSLHATCRQGRPRPTQPIITAVSSCPPSSSSALSVGCPVELCDRGLQLRRGLRLQRRLQLQLRLRGLCPLCPLCLQLLLQLAPLRLQLGHTHPQRRHLVRQPPQPLPIHMTAARDRPPWWWRPWRERGPEPR